MIVANTRKNLDAIVIAKLAFVGVAKSNTKYFMVQNKQLEKNLQVVRQEVEQLRAAAQKVASTQFHLEEMKASILAIVLTLGQTMWNLYEELLTMHMVAVHLHGLQQKCKDLFKTLRNVQASIVVVHEWSM